MNRQFKFRVWNGENLIYIPYCVENGYVDWLARNGKYNIKTKYEIQQFTGLTDKNGKEIYEGDILHKDRYTDWEVIYEPPSFMVRNVSNYPFYQMDKHSCLDREIIGNIFENPELLK